MSDFTRAHHTDVAIVGAGAAGLATAIFVARRLPAGGVIALDGARKPGAKIRVSGGGRCNVTNHVVTPADFAGGNRRVIERVLRAFPAEDTVAFFREVGVELYEEEQGKLFPRSDDAGTVVAALVREVGERGVRLLTNTRVTALERDGAAFRLHANNDALGARSVVLATGGQSLPRTGSDGSGYRLAQQLGHTLVPTTPALVPLLLDGDLHMPLSGIAQDVEVAVHAAGDKPVRTRGALLWTHFGVSGPAVLDASRFWHRARLEQRPVQVLVNFLPGMDFPAAECRLLELVAAHPKARLHTVLGELLPARVAEAVLRHLGIDGQVAMSYLPRDARRHLVHALLAWPLPVRDSRGYQYAEVTAGGIPLAEVDPRTLASRCCPGLYFAGEILDVDGRIGGFNFQWAWSSAFVAAAGVAQRLAGTAT
ncbi:MAG TPA: NAD(P)/FAD-dependent oxidoreductase [Phycisphaerae bacterium]|nr:NAD(P)/FAD-dependent oxidoreductase [Phycisphaerae bacterium]HNU46014.1 NAD(P)/FAD-dependent oxidoreductase [Phycisphaerae bacterium]